MNRFVEDIRQARHAGRCRNDFGQQTSEVLVQAGLITHTACSFPSIAGGYTPYFEQHEDGSYSLIDLGRSK
jgi:hypothetical protein